MIESPVRINVSAPQKQGAGFLWDATAQLGPTWRQSIRRVGGYWMAWAEMAGAKDDHLEMFQDGFMRTITAHVGGAVVWEGFVGDMTLMVGGMEYRRSWLEMANRVKVRYTRMGDNMLTNGSVESGAWTGYNTPTTCAQSTTWRTLGTYSCWIASGGANKGATIQTGMTITALTYYEARCTVNIISGTWVLEIYRTDTGAALGSVTESRAGQIVLRCSVDDDNTYAGTVGLRLYSSGGAGEAYADAAVFQLGPARAETGWADDAASQAEYGVIEKILSKSGMAEDEANVLRDTHLAEHAWGRVQSPEIWDLNIAAGRQESRLRLTLYGFVFSLANRYAQTAGTAAASSQVSSLVGEAEFVTAGVVDSNTMNYQLADEEGEIPPTLWDGLRDITLAGDASGNTWMGGVYEGRKFNYVAMDTALQARLRGGVLMHPTGGLMEPWFLLPGLVWVDDLPAGPGALSGRQADDPHVVMAEEVTFDAAAYLRGKVGVEFRTTVRKV